MLDPTFKYTPSGSTDVRKTWAKFRREQRKADELRVKAKLSSNVAQLPAKVAK